MKKVLVAIAAVAMVAGLASCKKDCECTWTVKSPNPDVIPDQTQTIKTPEKLSKSDCEAFLPTGYVAGDDVTLKCESK